MKEFNLNFISAVDFPAQEGAQSLLLKRKDPLDIEKSKVLTTSVGGHSHLLNTHDSPGSVTTWEAGESGFGHDHPWIELPDGGFLVGEADGHSHDVAQVSKAEDEPEKSVESHEAKVTKESDMTEKEIAELQKRLAKSEAISGFSDVLKAHYKDLDEAGQEAFISKTDAERVALVEKAAEKDAVVYTDDEGIEYRKSDDPRLVSLAKRSDAARVSLKVEKDNRLTDALRKRADENLRYYPGDGVHKIAMLKAIEGIDDEGTRDGIYGILSANNNKMAFAFSESGHQNTSDESKEIEKALADPEATLEKMAQEIATAENIDFNAAYAKAIDTPNGQALYTHQDNARRSPDMSGAGGYDDGE